MSIFNGKAAPQTKQKELWTKTDISRYINGVIRVSYSYKEINSY